ncbi:1-acylglycerol-3-phosphate O-acyltransferase PNPLA3 [Elephas maximus indicus]|uniref:1-acylglycerol-3-phosphate O-acyltransferase PNPLA3 n=1 Tax=Elephas maximus indicus TaxID=99487 RepID=UPI0021161AA8|nr:1-acylglycerol-3-phosphate O-acyltransferase PNPLA3 [Elephas maximus indicus]
MYDPERGWSLSFVGCGFLGFYHVGATRCLSERAPHLLRDARMFFGCSAGSLHIASFLAGVPLDRTIQVLMDLGRAIRRQKLGLLQPSFSFNKYLRDRLHRELPANIHQLVSGKISVSLTRVSDGKNVLVSDFQSKEEVVDALLCSCFIPFLSGLIPPTFRGERYMDGGASNNMPFADDKTTITVSPYFGEHDICPKVKSSNFLYVNFTMLSLRLCSANAYLLVRTIHPGEPKVLGEICLRGYLDTVRFLEEKGICKRPGPCLNLASEDRDSEARTNCWENMSLEPPREVVALETKPEEDELLDHLRLSILPWDESILETLSPKLLIAVREAIKDRGGYMSKICSFMPIRIISYLMLPCTLPVETAVTVLRSLAVWPSDIYDNLRWLWWVTSRVCFRLVECLLPTSRSLAPASSPQAFPPKPEPDGHCWPSHSSMDLHDYPMDCPVGAKARAAQRSILKSSLTFFSGNQAPSGAGGDSTFPACPADSSL